MITECVSQMSKRKLSEGSQEGADEEIKEKKALVQLDDPPCAFFVTNPFVVGTAKMGIDPFNTARVFYHTPVADASQELRLSTVIETNRTVVWLMPEQKYNCAEFTKVWEGINSMPTLHYSREPIITEMVAQYLPARSKGNKAPVAELVFSYIRSRGITFGELWEFIQVYFHETLTLEQRDLLQLRWGCLADTFEYSKIVDFQIAPSYDGQSVVMWPVFEPVHKIH